MTNYSKFVIFFLNYNPLAKSLSRGLEFHLRNKKSFNVPTTHYVKRETNYAPSFMLWVFVNAVPITVLHRGIAVQIQKQNGRRTSILLSAADLQSGACLMWYTTKHISSYLTNANPCNIPKQRGEIEQGAIAETREHAVDQLGQTSDIKLEME